MEFIDYIAATTPAFMKFIFRAPPLSYVTNVFTLPFDSSVWHYSFVMVAIVVVFIYVIVAWEWREIKFRNTIVDHPTPPLRPNFFDVLMLEIGAITQQGSDVEPQSNAGRIITIFTLATLMFLYTSYSANIVALLQSTTNSIQTLEDLLHSRIKLGVEDIIYGHYYFEVCREITTISIFVSFFSTVECERARKEGHLRAKSGPQRPETQLHDSRTRNTEGAGGVFCLPRGAPHGLQPHQQHISRRGKVWP